MAPTSTTLKVMVDRDASDVYLTVDLPANYRVQGTIQPIGDEIVTNEDLEALALAIMRDRQRKEFEETMEMNLALYYPDLGRFRVNVFRQTRERRYRHSSNQSGNPPDRKARPSADPERYCHDEAGARIVCRRDRFRQIYFIGSHDRLSE